MGLGSVLCLGTVLGLGSVLGLGTVLGLVSVLGLGQWLSSPECMGLLPTTWFGAMAIPRVYCV